MHDLNIWYGKNRHSKLKAVVQVTGFSFFKYIFKGFTHNIHELPLRPAKCKTYLTIISNKDIICFYKPHLKNNS